MHSKTNNSNNRKLIEVCGYLCARKLVQCSQFQLELMLGAWCMSSIYAVCWILIVFKFFSWIICLKRVEEFHSFFGYKKANEKNWTKTLNIIISVWNDIVSSCHTQNTHISHSFESNCEPLVDVVWYSNCFSCCC